jgi:hypothetical protein
MSEVAVTAMVSLFVFAGAIFGMFLNRVLPPEHISEDTRQVVNVAVGLIATLAALVLGLMVASAKASFDARSEEIKQSAARIVLLDRSLRQFGPEAGPARDLLVDITKRRMMLTWLDTNNINLRDELQTEGSGIQHFQALLRELKPADDAHRWLQTRALTLSAELEQTRWLLLESGESSIQRPFLIVLVLWLAVIFAGLGLFAPRNRTATAVIVICAFSVSTAIFLILEMDQPFDGLMQVSDQPLRNAFAQIAR